MNRRLRIALGAAAWAALIALPAAQNLPKGTELNPGSVKPGNGNYIVIGCISRQGQNYIITDSRATPPATYRIDGDPDLMRIHVNHTLEIGGGITPASGGNGMPTLKAQSVIYISPMCVKLK